MISFLFASLWIIIIFLAGYHTTSDAPYPLLVAWVMHSLVHVALCLRIITTMRYFIRPSLIIQVIAPILALMINTIFYFDQVVNSIAIIAIVFTFLLASSIITMYTLRMRKFHLLATASAKESITNSDDEDAITITYHISNSQE